MTDYTDLIAKLESAKEGDRELDRQMALALSGASEDRTEGGELRGYYRGGFWVSIGPIEPVTTSVDAILTLIEKRLPGWEWHVLVSPHHHNGEGCTYADLQPPDATHSANNVAIKGKLAPIALCIALLTALQAQEATPRQAP